MRKTKLMVIVSATVILVAVGIASLISLVFEYWQIETMQYMQPWQDLSMIIKAVIALVSFLLALTIAQRCLENKANISENLEGK